MAYSVNEATKTATTRCKQNFQCLNDNDWKPCSIGGRVGEFLEIKKSESVESCNYCMSFGFIHFCHCPVRHKIYDKYKE